VIPLSSTAVPPVGHHLLPTSDLSEAAVSLTRNTVGPLQSGTSVTTNGSVTIAVTVIVVLLVAVVLLRRWTGT
jgi:hypothetical protein